MSTSKYIAIMLITLAASITLADERFEQDTSDQQLLADKKRLVTDTLELTAMEAEHFWPVYEAFQFELRKMTEKRKRIIGEFGENYETMNDAQARKFMLDRLELGEARYHLMKDFLFRFEQVLPIRKLARYYHIEGKIRAFVEAGIEEELPLIH